MSSSSAIEAGKAFVRIGGSDTELQKVLDRAAGKVKSFGASIAKIGASMFAVGQAIQLPLEAAAVAFADAGEKIALASARTGASAENISTLGLAAQACGGDLESLETAFLKMSRTIQGATEGQQKANDVLQLFGVTVEDVAKLSGDERFKLFADRLSKISDGNQRAAIASELFGRGVLPLLPLLSQGSAGIEKMQAHFRSLGLEWSGADANGARQFSQQMREMWAVVERVEITIGQAMVPALQRLITGITAGAVAASSWIKTHQSVVTTAYKIGGVLVAAGVAFAVFGGAVVAAGFVLSGLSSIFYAVGFGIGMLMGPLTYIVGGLGAAAGAFIYLSGVGTAVANGLISAFKQIWQSIQFVFDNTSTAAEAWAAIVSEASMYAREGWSSFKGYMTDLWTDISEWIGNVTLNTTANFLKTWEKVLHAWRSTTSAVADFILDKMTNVGEQMDETNKRLVAEHPEWTPQQKAQILGKGSAEYFAHDRAQRDKESDSQLDSKLAAITKEYDERADALRQNAKDERTKNADELKAEKDKEKATREAYEAELKRRHEASGQASLSQKIKDAFASIAGANIPGLPGTASGEGFENLKKNTQVVGSFNPYAARTFGAESANKGVEKKIDTTNELLQKLIDVQQNGVAFA